ncbi:LOW QUALITY PROTEIN: uncharacterized protein LOC135209720 [Macrobrachium nipponense]|uniref:LOW QUALITY PROTEIN: uncharacterized protein LOC135209720 n=1 Tax=Macrobrachium nipponense TaxID=159736 RepID=UPI0030C8B3B8
MCLFPSLTFIFAFIGGLVASKNTKDSMIDVWVVSGGRASLPCLLKPKLKDDQPVLVLWYRRFSSSLPIYSYDARVGDFSSGVRWWDEVALGRRGYFVPSSAPALVLEPAHAHDQDIYTCRVDYRVSTSTTTRVNLTVVVPPGPPVVIWEGREMVGTVGPLQENQLTELTCRSVGGRPSPALTWWNEGRELPLLYANSSLDPVTGTSVSEATLSVAPKRELQGGSLTCDARTPTTSTPHEEATVPPRSASVVLNITLSPVEVRILEPNPIVATSGSTISVVCRALGSHPPAELSWWRGIRSLEPHVTHAIQDGGNITTASLTIAVTGEDDGATVTCRGVNPALSRGEPLTDRRKLVVYYEPIVDLSLGKPLEAENIKEEDDVYFECNVKSNPKLHRIEWYHNGQEILQDINAGVVVSQQSLVIRGVVRSHSGSYTCVATNAQGRGVSNTFFLTVQHAPICAGSTGTERTQGAARGSVVKAKCRVEAEPSSNLIWSWVRKRTDGSEEILSPDKYVIEGLTSTLTVVPGRREDYGRLLCRATNNVGRQKEACVVNLVPAGPPDTPTNCSATTVNPDGMKPALVVSCLEGFDGGLPQNFLLEAWQDGLVIANISSEYPEWVVSTVEAGKRVILNIVGHNIRGRSDPVTMKIQTSSAQHRAAPVQESAGEVPPIVGAALGGMGVILVLLLVGVAIVRGSYRCPRKPVAEKTLASSSTEALDPDVVQSIKHLDIVPCVREEHSNEEIYPMFTYSVHIHPPGDGEKTEETLETVDESIGNAALLAGRVQTHLSASPRQRRPCDRLNLFLDQSEDSGVSESESGNELKIPGAERRSSPVSGSKGESGRPYSAVPKEQSPEKASSGGRRHSPSFIGMTATSSSTEDIYDTSEGGQCSSRINHECVSSRDRPLDPSSREIFGLSEREPPDGGESAAVVEVICHAVSPTGPVTNKGQKPPKKKKARPLPQGEPVLESQPPERDPARILSLDRNEIGVPVTLYKAPNGELLLLPRKPDYEGIGVQLTSTPVYAIATLPKAAGRSGRVTTQTTTKENESSPKLPVAAPINKSHGAKQVGEIDYIPPVHPDMCRRESSV